MDETGETMGRAPAPLRVGVCILYLGDARALDVTLRSLDCLQVHADRVVVVEQPFGRREGGPSARHVTTEWISVEPPLNPRSAGLARLDDCDLVVFVREGVAFGPTAIGAERARFASSPDLRAALLTSRLVMGLDEFLGGDGEDPYETLRQRGAITESYAPRYFTPCMLTVATKREPIGTFESFASRSEWASARLFLDSMRAPAIEAASDAFGLIANDPDRRDTELHGREAYEALSQFGEAYPPYQSLARSDMRRLAFQQIAGVLRLSRPKVRLRFLRGFVEGHRRDAAVRRRMARDISDLA
ncbi:hypothetical protein ACFQI3_14690 [Hansschlegelia quercus]|uniref:Uncharacterized protein n=1 Tax=Hansschlegelia quercus TaxID=2528245 RepID=A0A4Q9GG19_9HYPH|nr:hypothetical protein [Hansschlegelia quercus]TBN47321.1 hypothetical protein EYR15_16405 [Hansschlegelia quercus]